MRNLLFKQQSRALKIEKANRKAIAAKFCAVEAIQEAAAQAESQEAAAQEAEHERVLLLGQKDSLQNEFNLLQTQQDAARKLGEKS